MSIISRLHVISQVPIPFHESGEFAPEKLSNILSSRRTAASDSLLVGAASVDESDWEISFRKRLFRQVAEQAPAAPRLIADVNAATPERAADLAREAAELGYDAISLCLSVATTEGLFSGRSFVRAVATASSLPIYVRIFDRPRGDATLDHFSQLLEKAKIGGVFVYCHDSRLLRRLRRHPANAETFCGLEESLIAHLTFGATGVVSHLAYFLAPLFRAIQEAVVQDDLFRAVALQKLTEGFVDVASRMGLLAATKGWLKLLGVDCGPCRGMNGCLTVEEWRSLAAWLEAYLRDASAPTPAVSV